MAEELEIEIFNVVKKFPADERFRSVDQLNRSSASVCNNIAECYHKSSVKDKIRILEIAKGEAEETRTNILRCARKGFLDKNEAIKISEKYIELLKAMNGYIRFLRTNSTNKLKN